MALAISTCNFDAKTPQMNLNTSPTSFEGLRGLETPTNLEKLQICPETTARWYKINLKSICDVLI